MTGRRACTQLQTQVASAAAAAYWTHDDGPVPIVGDQNPHAVLLLFLPAGRYMLIAKGLVGDNDRSSATQCFLSVDGSEGGISFSQVLDVTAVITAQNLAVSLPGVPLVLAGAAELPVAGRARVACRTGVDGVQAVDRRLVAVEVTTTQ